MNILFCTQSESLQLFDALRLALKDRLPVTKAGFTIADSLAYSRWLSSQPDFEKKDYFLLKEWEVTSRPFGKPDLAKLAQYEKDLGGDAGLFGAIVADRRLFMGPDCTFTQDYRRRFTDEELLCILQRGLEQIEELFNRLKPDVVISFICVTMLDYLVYLFARARGVRILNLRPTRIADRISFSRLLNDPSPELVASYSQIMEGTESKYQAQAQSYIKRVREEHGRYEGVVRPSDKPALQVSKAKYSRFAGILSAAKNYISYTNSVAASDNHVPNPLRAVYYAAVRNPMQAKKMKRLLENLYVRQDDLSSLRYAFYPLHTEPEVSLLVYGRPYVNQIEIIRMLAMNLPADMVLLVKEHPWMVGKRSLSSYGKILNIPRVKFVDPKLEARTIVQNADLVTVVTGSVALEAAMLGKPVITFGDCPYNLLPDTMVRRCDDPRNLQIIIRDAINQYRNNEKAMEAYVAAVFETSESVNLYSVLLRKNNVYVEKKSEYEHEILKLGDLVISNIKNYNFLAASRPNFW